MDQDPELRALLKKYPKNTAAIRYKRVNGRTNVWFLSGRSGVDNEETLREHWERWYPETEFVGWAIK